MKTVSPVVRAVRAWSVMFVMFAVAFGGFFNVLDAQAVISEIEVTAPIGGEHLNGNVVINWTVVSDNAADTVDIYYSTNNFTSSTKLTASAVLASDETYSWDTVAAGIPDGTTYRIRVQSTGNAIQGSSPADFRIDNTPPSITSATTHDDNGDGNVDKATVVLSEPVRDSSFAAADFSIDGTSGTSISTGSADDNTFDVLFAGVVGSEEKDLTYTAGTGHDLADPGNLLATVTITATDAAAPVFLSAETQSTTQIDLTFSEDLNGATVTNADFSVDGHTLGAPDASEVSPGVVRLTVTAPFNSTATPLVTYNTIASNGVKDLNDNMAIGVSVTPTDGAGPFLAEVTPVTSPTNDTTPNYMFSADDNGSLVYGGSCSSIMATATAGSNTITLDVLAEGTYSDCTITATDGSGNVGNTLTVSTFTIDITAPVIDAHADATIEATSNAGAAVSYTAPNAVDAVDGTFPATCLPASGSTFALGITPVNCNATDTAGNPAVQTSFNVTVQDTTAPVIDAHADVTEEATSGAGATVNYTAPNSTDAVDGTLPAVCLPASGTVFPVGDTVVTCNKTDVATNSALATNFTIHVVDTTDPVVDDNPDVTFEATSASGAVATWTDPAATDLVDGPLVVACAPISGSTFAFGTTVVTCSVTDAHGNTGSSEFNVTVEDTTSPIIAAHPDVNATADQLGGAVVIYTVPDSTDVVDGTLPAVCVPASGSIFPLGDTTVTCTKIDAHGNSATPVTFTVTVEPDAITQLDVSATSPIAVGGSSAVTVQGKDQFGNVTTNQSGNTVIVSVDNGGLLGSPLLTLTSGVAATTLTKDSAGAVNVTVSSGILTPDTTVVAFIDFGADLTAPALVSHTPADGATSVVVNEVGRLTFSEALLATTVTSANIKLRKFADDSAVSAIVSLVEGGTQVVITPTASLEAGTQYYFTVSTGVSDLAGNPLTVALDSSTKDDREFTTAAVVTPTGITIDEVADLTGIAETDNTYLGGWHYRFRITVNNTAETKMFVKFADWQHATSASATVGVSGNTKLFINESGVTTSVAGLSEADIENGVTPFVSYNLGNAFADQTVGAATLVGDLSGNAGRQVQFDVFTRLPVSTVPGAYSSTFNICTNATGLPADCI